MDWSKRSPEQRLQQLQNQAELWRDPEYELRAIAVERELEGDSRITEEELAFAINQAMLRIGGLQKWPASPAISTVGVSGCPTHPTCLLDLACYAMGCDFGVLLAPDFALPPIVELWMADTEANTSSHIRELPRSNWSDHDVHLKYGSIEAADSSNGMSEATEQRSRVVHLKGRSGVAVIDGKESMHEREGIAEDALLFTGISVRSVRLIWAKRDVQPDAYLEAFAALRGVFPAHEQLSGSLEMNRAFLEAQDQPHAYAEDLSFLLSRGEPEVQQPGHVRWVPYEDISEVQRWLQHNQETLSWVTRRKELTSDLASTIASGEPGEAHRPDFLEMDGGSSLIEAIT